jgi:hypothetical protein
MVSATQDSRGRVWRTVVWGGLWAEQETLYEKQTEAKITRCVAQMVPKQAWAPEFKSQYGQEEKKIKKQKPQYLFKVVAHGLPLKCKIFSLHHLNVMAGREL